MQYELAAPVSIQHPDVVCAQMQSTSEAVVVAVMLRPVYGRTERMRVLAEVAQAMRAYTDAAIYVVADVDVYQAILHDQEVAIGAIRRRVGCYHLPPAGG